MLEKRQYSVNEPLPLEGARNIRELGGYETVDGRCTRTGVYLRSDGTNALSARDLEALEQLGVTLVVDMRSPDEVALLPSCFENREGVCYENIVMFDGLQSSMFRDAMPKSMAELYCRLLDGGREQYSRIFRLFLDNAGVSLFHCTAGKDRTGVVAMLLLQLAGVPEPLIVADYAVSERNLIGLFEQQHENLREMGVTVPEFVFGSRPEDMEATLRHLHKNYGGAAGYLKGCGLTDEEVKRLFDRFVE